MLRIGSLAPEFGGAAIIDGSSRTLSWEQIQRGRVLALLFDSVQTGSQLVTELAAHPGIVEDLARLEANLCVVCRDPIGELAAADVRLTLFDDSASEVAALYGMLQVDGTPLWGYCIVDADGFVRRLVQCDAAASPSLEELLRHLAAAADADSTDAPC